MNAKKANRFYLCVILVMLLSPDLTQYLGQFLPAGMRTGFSLILPQLLLLLLSMITLAIGKESPKKALPMHRIHLSDVGLLFVITLLIEPITTLCSEFSDLFSPNLVSMATADIPMAPLLVSTLVAAPLCEEICFRGVLFTGHRNSLRVGLAVFLSGLCFGLYHMTLSQVFYTFVLGLFLAMVVETTGNLLSSMVLHLMFNLLSGFLLPIFSAFLPASLSNFLYGGSAGAFAVLALLSALCTPFAVLAVHRLTKREVPEPTAAIPEEKKPESKAKASHAVTPTLVIGLLLALSCLIWAQSIILSSLS